MDNVLEPSPLICSAFKRVLPLPSDSWDEFGGSVFCHHHGPKESAGESSVSVVAPSSMQLTPRVGDCLTGATVLLLTEHSLDMQNIRKVGVVYLVCCCLFLIQQPFLTYYKCCHEVNLNHFLFQDALSKRIYCRRCRLFLGTPMSLIKGVCMCVCVIIWQGMCSQSSVV